MLSRLRNFQVLLILLSLSSNAFAWDETQRLVYVKSVTPQVSREGQVRVKYLRACGEKFRGLAVRESDSAVALGVIVERADRLCSALPSEESFVSPLQMMAGDNRKILSVKVAEGERVQLTEIQDVLYGQNQTSIRWQDSCRAPVGLVLSPTQQFGSKDIGLFMAVSAEGGSKGVNCPRELKTFQFRAVDFAKTHVELLRRPGAMTDLFLTKLVAPVAVSIDAKGELTVSWMSNCREKALGVLFGGDDPDEVAIVAAFAPNISCESRMKALTRYTVREVAVSVKHRLKAMSSTKISEWSARGKERFEMIPVSSASMLRSDFGEWFVAGFRPSCGRNLGIVVGNDGFGNVAVAGLTDAGQRICRVANSLSEVYAKAPIVGPGEGPMPKIFGLKVFGTSID